MGREVGYRHATLRKLHGSLGYAVACLPRRLGYVRRSGVGEANKNVESMATMPRCPDPLRGHRTLETERCN